MAHPLLRSLSTLAVPLALAGAVELPPMAPINAQPPAPKTNTDLLVDRVIPAFGVKHNAPYRMDSRAQKLYNEIRIFCSRVEAALSDGSLARPVNKWGRPLDAEGRPIPGAAPVLIPAPVMPEEITLLELTEALSRLDADLIFPNYYERWHIDSAFRDLDRTAQSLTITLGNERFADIVDAHRGWVEHYHKLVMAAQALKAEELIMAAAEQGQLITSDEGLRMAIAMDMEIPYPDMVWEKDESGAYAYEPVTIPSVPQLTAETVAAIQARAQAAAQPATPAPTPQPEGEVEEAMTPDAEVEAATEEMEATEADETLVTEEAEAVMEEEAPVEDAAPEDAAPEDAALEEAPGDELEAEAAPAEEADAP